MIHIERINLSHFKQYSPNFLPFGRTYHTHNPCLPDIIQASFGFESGFFSIQSKKRFYEPKTIGLISGNFIGKKFVSLPHMSHSSLLIHKDTIGSIQEIHTALEKKFGWIEIRTTQAISGMIYDEKVNSLISLKGSIGEMCLSFSPQLRRKIRRSLEEGYVIAFNSNEDNPQNYMLLHDFYKVYTQNMKRLGSPHLSLKFMQNLVNLYKDGFRSLAVVYRGTKAIGGALNLEYQGYTENLYFSTLRDAGTRYASYFLNYHLIKKAIETGGHSYSLGRSTINSGVHKYKRQWTKEEEMLNWSYPSHLKGEIRKIPDLRRFYKLLPKFLTDHFGPMIAQKIY